MRRRGSTYRWLFLAGYGPPSGFDYPLDGFRPSTLRRPYFVPTALSGFCLRSFLLRPGIRDVSARNDLRTVSSGVAPYRLRDWPVRRTAVSRSLPSPESSDARLRYERTARRMLPWRFTFLRLQGISLGRDFARPPPSRFPAIKSFDSTAAGAPEYPSA